MIKRIVTRPDFDGVVCAVLLKKALGENLPVCWEQPNNIQKNRFQVSDGDVIANLPFASPCALWFDHHVSNQTDRPFKGIFRIAPSAAGLVYAYYKNSKLDCFRELVHQADKIDAARLTLDEINRPQEHPYVLLSMTIGGNSPQDLAYCDHLVALLGEQSITTILKDSRVAERCDMVVRANSAYETYLKQHTKIHRQVSLTDFRGLAPAPEGNRFLVYSLFPQTVVNMKVYQETEQIVIKLGHSIINRGCRVNLGCLLAQYGGGGHHGAGACRAPLQNADRVIAEILDILMLNREEKNDTR